MDISKTHKKPQLIFQVTSSLYEILNCFIPGAETLPTPMTPQQSGSLMASICHLSRLAREKRIVQYWEV